MKSQLNPLNPLNPLTISVSGNCWLPCVPSWARRN